MVECRECGKDFENKRSLRSHYVGSDDHNYEKEEFQKVYGSGSTSGSEKGVKSHEKVEEKLDKLNARLEDLSEKVRDLEGRELINELEDMGMKDQIAVIEDALGVRDPKQQKEKLKKLAELIERWDDLKIPEKVNWLYKKYRELEEKIEG